MNATPTRPEPLPVENFLDLTERLCALLADENEALRRRRLEQVRALQEDKERLSEVYRRAVAAFARDPERLRRVAPEQRERLHALAARQEELMASNARLLQTAIESSQRLLEAVIGAARRYQQSQSVAYGRHGQLSGGAGGARPALSINGTV